MERLKSSDQAQRLRNRASGSQRKGPRVITIASGKGGVGKSSLCVNLSIALSQLGSRVLVLDADFGLANVDVMLGVQAKYNLTHFLSGERKLSDIIQIGYDGVRFISGGNGVNELLFMDEEQLEKILQGLNELDMPIDFILCDAGAGIDGNIVHMAVSSTEVIVITTPEPTAVLCAYQLVKVITQNDDTLPVSVVVNRAESTKEAERVYEGLQDVLMRHLKKKVNRLGYIAMDAEVPRSIKRQTPVMVSAPETRFARDVRDIARTILDLPPSDERPSVLSRLFSRVMGR